MPPGANTAAVAPAPPPERGTTTLGSISDSYVSFLNNFRDQPDPNGDSTTIEEARRIPARSTSTSATAAVQPAYATAAGAPPAYNTAAAQPSYGAAAPQAAYSTAAAQPANTAAPQPPYRNTAIGYGDPAPAYSPPPRPYATAAVAPAAPSSSYAAAAPAAPAQQTDRGGGVYPSQSLFDLFKGNSSDSGSSRPGNVVHPPSTYTPLGSSGGAAQPAASDAAAAGAGVYPQQSLADIFSGK